MKKEELEQENKDLKSQIKNMKKWCQLIIDIGFDYDGYNDVKNLKMLIDELVVYSKCARDNIDLEQYFDKIKGDERNGRNIV